jgi:predicted amidohydrolase YtcJ
VNWRGVGTALLLLSHLGLVLPSRADAIASADATSPSRVESADLIFFNGRIHTEDPNRSVAQALAVRGNSIAAVGGDSDVKSLAGPRTRIVDLRGRVVLPGFIDAHTHPAQSAQDLNKCTLRDQTMTPEEIASAVRQCLAHEPGDHSPWLEVIGVNASGLKLTLPQLDKMLPDRPLLLEDTSGHTVFSNSATLRAAHIDRSTADPVGGRIEHDDRGQPTGMLLDAATDLALKAAPPPGVAFEVSQLDRALAQMRAVGLTSVQDADVDEHYMQLYKKLYDEHHLQMRVRGTFGLTDTNRAPEVLIGEAVSFRKRWDIDPYYLRADAIKIFADGVIEYPMQTAALLQPYLDKSGRATDNRGPTYYTQTQLNRVVAAADAAGLTVHVHAIGDRAVRSALDAFAFARAKNGIQDNRGQIAHLELVDPHDFPRFKELGVIANFQLLWAESDPYTVDATTPYIGVRRAKYLYPAGSLLAAHAMIVGGSDWGVSSFDPFLAMEHAITRRQSATSAPLLPEQSIPLQSIVDAYTINAAFALRQERMSGSLESGKRADLVVLDRDIFALDPARLHETRVLQTYLDGKLVFAAEQTHK